MEELKKLYLQYGLEKITFEIRRDCGSDKIIIEAFGGPQEGFVYTRNERNSNKLTDLDERILSICERIERDIKKVELIKKT